MSSNSQTADEATANVAAPRHPTLLVIRPADGPDTAPALTQVLGHLARVVTLAWSGVLDARSLTALIEDRLANRDLVLFAEGAMAAAALAATAPGVRGVVVIDPTDADDVAPHPVDVILRTPGAQSPAFVARPGVRVHRASAGVRQYAAELENLINEVICEACRQAAPNSAPRAALLDGPLLDATPLGDGALGYIGPEGEAFTAAYAARQPDANASVLAGEIAPLDILVVGGPVPLERLSDLLASLRPGGWLVARWCAADAVPHDLADALAAAGLELTDPVDHGGSAVLRAQRTTGAERPAEPLLLAYNAISPWMMDIRTRLPVQQMASDPDLAVRYFKPLRSVPTAPFDQPKVVVLQRPSLTRIEDWLGTVAPFIVRNWVCAIEYDDHPLLVAEVAGQPPTEAEFRRLSYVHGVQTSVEPLADLFRPYNPEVAIFPNAVFELLPFPQGPRPPRVFYGATPRGEIPVAVARSFDQVIARFPDIEFVVVGPRAVFDALPTSRKTYHGYMTYESYLDLMATCTVSLAPINAHPMHDTKSDAKFLDASRAGALTIASPTIYSRTIRHGENGLIANELADWPRLLTQAFAEPEVARGMARQAWKDVRDGRMFTHQIAARKAWYRSLWERREELNEALMERLPGLREQLARLRAG